MYSVFRLAAQSETVRAMCGGINRSAFPRRDRSSTRLVARTPQKLRNEQANAEKSVLEAKRARVLDDMNRRQKRLQRLRREEEA